MVSIVVPIYKTEQFLSDCLVSIQNQTYKDFEVLCVNDGSPDNSAYICESFVKKDRRFVLINQPNKGVSNARNNALSRAKGEYVCFVDSDDIISPNYLTTLLGMAKDGAFAVCSYCRNLKDLDKKTQNVMRVSARDFVMSVFEEAIEHPNICMMLFRNSIIQMQHLYFTEGCVRNEDTEFYIKYLMYEKNVVYTDCKCYFYRVNMASEMHVTNFKSLTALDASKRIGRLLVAHKFTDDVNIDLYPSVQSLLYHLGREENKVIYDYIHEEYDVRFIMRSLLHFPTIRRKIVSLFYLTLGRDLFYKLLNSNIANILPL